MPADCFSTCSPLHAPRKPLRCGRDPPARENRPVALPAVRQPKTFRGPTPADELYARDGRR